ncbi:hypothetical protein [Telmatospirillum sp.]|uniref:hypothetical protein n=1 Tax=Telmatospirillum sp. TaxID=2079197 RepID=UPI00284AF805|nr:hypothetical protein [Telmatospirillum sp.]MDR3438989.1 hypothetical protein [Telmatospirillum sp.]
MAKKFSRLDSRCLHCEILDLVGDHIALGLSINEVIFKQVEALSSVLAGAALAIREEMMTDAITRIREMTAESANRRVAAGVPFYEVRRRQ